MGLLGMLATVVLVLVLAWLCTRWLAGMRLGVGPRQGGERRMQVVDRLSLGKDVGLILVRLGERYVLLGVSPSGVTQLRELTEEEAAAWRDTDPGPGGLPGPGTSFREALADAWKRKRK